nr:immunoglobulin heavy chain junction region [Mus musculus]NSM04600.1 immunoglobulin heavy chain junction region [Mus musculus]NSM04603.1 immunoglobulin heavy chain junction region [Mus musculus]NSM04761.1 immunoglobulin heavy chain junction region [Mus musculus]NSM07046.1 immunoglobulin heavy chain junction region [Mus musculus]
CARGGVYYGNSAWFAYW